MHRVGRFEVADRRQQLIVAIMSLPLIYGAALVFEALARLGWWRILARVQSAWSRSVLRVLAVRATIGGSEHLPDGPAILLPLHEGFLDVPLLMATGRSMRFIARDELFEWPQLGRVLRTGGHVLLPTAPTLGNYRSLVANAIDVLGEQHDLVVFPQGSILGIELAFAHGARHLAARCKVPVVPIVITGTHRVWEHPYSPILRRGCLVRMEVLAAIPPDAGTEVWTAIERRMKELALAQIDAPTRRFVPSRDGYWDGYQYEIDPYFADLAEDIARHRTSREKGGQQLYRVSTPNIPHPAI